MIRPVVRVIRSRARRHELGSALITPLPSLTNAAVLESAAGGRYYLPAFQTAVQTAGGRETFRTDLSDDGTLTLYLSAEPPTGLAGTVGTASPYFDGLGFTLLLDASGGGTRIPMAATREGGNLWRLTTVLSGTDLKRAREALFDSTPNVALDITQRLHLAAQQTQAFIDENWSDAAIRQGLLDAFGGIPIDSPGTFFSMVSSGDPEYPQQFTVLDGTYTARIPVPPLPGYRQWQVDWKGRAYNYYQDNQDPARVFYAPEGFELAKGPAGVPTVSLLQFSLPDGDAPVDQARATFRVYGLPVVDFARIENAAQALKGRLGVTPRMVSLQDAHTVRTSFTLYFPNAQATASSPLVQPDAAIDLGAGLRNEISLNFTQFRALWAAIFSTAPENPLFRGWVDVDLLDGRYKERIDFNGRLPKDLEAAFFDDILDTVTDSTYPARFSVRTVPKAFAGPPEILELDVIFPGKAVTLTPSNPRVDVVIERSIRDIVIGKQNPEDYPYRLRVVHEDGSVTCCTGTARSDTPNLWLSVDQVAGCTGACA
ncbi:hypothetical protein [Roseomonas genomospecies 6]|uniref:hypothetical protein n=1 Tax=Roseomonas genomospecies 6 TaxID=214106 RepID=UPI0011F13571|nr:hypothetical protein [Roseomonas genomospecies 6]